MANQYTSYWLYQKYEIRGSQEAIPVYPNVYSVDGDGTMSKVIKIENDAACGYMPTGTTQYRWVNLDPSVDYYCDECPAVEPLRRWERTNDTICVEATAQYRTISGTPYCTGYDKYVDVYSQVSYDSGSTWTTTATTPTLVEADSEDCGYVPPTPTGTKFKATYSGGQTYSAACDSDTTLTTTTTKPSGYEASAMTSAAIGNCVTSIGYGAFWSCSGLTDITIPENSQLTSIGESAFFLCRSLTGITIPNSVTSISESAFNHCSSLTAITIPNSVTYIGGAFQGCSSLSSVTMPENSQLTTIVGWTFAYCSSLTAITIPNSVTYIAGSAFKGCSSLTGITVNATTPPTLGNSVFDNTNNCPIYVPAASVDAYKSASGWSTYSSRIQAIP